MAGKAINGQRQHADIDQCDGQAAECFRDGLAAQAVACFRHQKHGKHIAKVQTVYSMYDDTKSYSDFAELIFRVNGGLGVSSVASEVLYTYQNGVLTLGASADAAALYDVQGRKVADCQACGTITTADCQPGVYVLKVQADGRTSVSKILVK